jgi:hypothetical protein
VDQESAMLDLRTVINNLPIAIFVIGKDRRVLLNNRLAQKYLRPDQQESEAMRFGDQVGCANAVNNSAGCGATDYCQLCRVKSEIDDAFSQKKSTSHFETDIINKLMNVTQYQTKPYLSAKILDIEKSAMNSVDLRIKN